MRIVHFIHRYPPALGGAESYFARLSRHLAAAGEDVTVHTTNALDLEAFWWKGKRMLPPGVTCESGVTVHRHAIRHWPLRRYQLKLLSLLPIRPLQCLTLPCNPIAPTMRSVAVEGPIDVVHASAFPYAFPIHCALRLARKQRAPFVLTPFLHIGALGQDRDRSRKGYLSPAMQYLLRAADRIFVQTTLEADAIADCGIARERLVLQGMGVEPAECTGGDRAAARRRWGLPPDAVVIGHLANKSVEKGTVDLLKSAQMLWQKGVDFRLLLAGPEMPGFVEYWKSEFRLSGPPLPLGGEGLGVRGSSTENPNPLTPCPSPPGGERGVGRVVRLMELSEAEKRDFYAAIDMFAMPSRSDSFGIVFLEAWANRVPCVAYRAGGVAEVIRHERDGLLGKAGDLDELASHLSHLISNASSRTQLGAAGQERIHREHRWADKLELVRDGYAELMERKAPALHAMKGLRKVL